MAKHGKKFLEASKKIDRQKYYTVKEAIDLAKETSVTKFDSTIEVHMKTGLDPRQADQQIRDVVVLPNGLGKTVRVLVFCQGEGVAKAQEGGADYIADSDVAIATPDMMAKAGRLGRVLGPRGLMPNPKAGTVCAAADLPRVIKEAKAGRVEFRLDKSANLHVPVGKASFGADKLYENVAAYLDAVKKAKPSGAKGQFIKRVTISSTMGPGIRVDLGNALNLGALE